AHIENTPPAVQAWPEQWFLDFVENGTTTKVAVLGRQPPTLNPSGPPTAHRPFFSINSSKRLTIEFRKWQCNEKLKQANLAAGQYAGYRASLDVIADGEPLPRNITSFDRPTVELPDDWREGVEAAITAYRKPGLALLAPPATASANDLLT